MDLGKLQEDFAQALFSDHPETDVIAASRRVKAQGELSAAQRVGIYRNSTHGILRQHLAALYPVCRQLIGEQRFDVLCDGFVDQQAPQTPYLSQFGISFVDFLANHALLKTHAYIEDVARLEWMRHSAWHQPNQVPADFSRLALLDEQQQAALRFELPTSAQLLHSRFAVDELWLAHQSRDARQVSEYLATIALNTETYLIIWRQGRQLQQSGLTSLQYQFLKSVQQGETLGRLSSALGDDVAGLLATGVQQGWVCSF